VAAGQTRAARRDRETGGAEDSSAGGKIIPWTRDPVDVYAFHIDVPQGAKKLDLEFQFVSATVANQGRIVMTPNLLNLQWQSVSLYPAGYFTRRIPVQAKREISRGLDGGIGAARQGERQRATSMTRPITTLLVDSPVLAGRYLPPDRAVRRVSISDVFADTPDELAATAEQIGKHKNLVDQAVKTLRRRALRPLPKSCSRSATSSAASAWSITAAPSDGTSPGYFTKWDDEAHQPQCAAARIRPIAGTASTAAARTCGRRFPHSRCADRCSGCMKARPVLGLCAPGALGPGEQGRHAGSLCRDRREPRQSRGRATGARWSTPPTIR
jgi:hypothetical protein